VGNHYIIPLWDEVKNSVVTKYYFAGATRLAVRTNGTLKYLLADHLGSTALSTDANGTVSAAAMYKAFGELRSTPSALGTDYKFTGQREEASLGLYFFVSRWFDPSLGRFTSPDSIVPTSTQGTQAWDRYAFVNNNPVRYTDPTGHAIQGQCNYLKNYNCEASQEEESVNSEENTWCPPDEQDCTVYEHGFATENDLAYSMELLDKAIDNLVLAAFLAGLGGNGKLAAYYAYEIRQLTTLKNFFSEAEKKRKDSPTGEIAMSVYADESTGGVASVMYTYENSYGTRDSNTYIPISPMAIFFISLLQGRGDPPPPYSAPFILQP